MIALFFFSAFLIWTAITIGLRPEHYISSGLILGLFWLSPKTAKVAAILFPIFLGAAVYDNAQLLVGLRGEIHVTDLYLAELRWFGINTASGRQILSQFFQEHHFSRYLLLFL